MFCKGMDKEKGRITFRFLDETRERWMAISYSISREKVSPGKAEEGIRKHIEMRDKTKGKTKQESHFESWALDLEKYETLFQMGEFYPSLLGMFVEKMGGFDDIATLQKEGKNIKKQAGKKKPTYIKLGTTSDVVSTVAEKSAHICTFKE